MARKCSPGLNRRGGIWHIRKTFMGELISESTGTKSLALAEEILAARIGEILRRQKLGERPRRRWEEAVVHYAQTANKATLGDDLREIRMLDPYLRGKFLDEVHMGVLQRFVADRRAAGVKPRTINSGLQVARRILNLASSEWIDDTGQPWLAAVPKIAMVPLGNTVRQPYPLSWEEQERLIERLRGSRNPMLAEMVLFKVNTGCREREVTSLRWDWEVPVPELGCSVFIIPAEQVKNRQQRLVILNSIARGVVDRQRGRHLTHVFTFRGHPMRYINNSAWVHAVKDLKIPVRVHDLKHTYGARLRAANVPEEDRRDLIGHKSGRSMTTHYSQADLTRLLEYAERVVPGVNKPQLVLLKNYATGR